MALPILVMTSQSSRALHTCSNLICSRVPWSKLL